MSGLVSPAVEDASPVEAPSLQASPVGEVGVVGKAVFPFKLSSLSALLTRPSEPALVVGVAVEPWLLERFFPMDPFLKRTSCRGVEILVYSSSLNIFFSIPCDLGGSHPLLEPEPL